MPNSKGVCSECGGPMSIGPNSAAPDRRRCRKCQQARPKKASRSYSGTCVVCGSDFIRPYTTPQQTCSRHCGGLVSAWKQLRPGLPFNRDAMGAISDARKMKRTLRCRTRRLRQAKTWDGITDEEILDRDGWRCQIPECQYRSRKINQRYKYPDPRSPGVDHIVPLSLGGDDTCVNKRAAHHGCNMARGNQMGHEQLLLIGSIREPPLETEIAGTVRERRKPKPPKPKVLKTRQCACGAEFLAKHSGRSWRCADCLESSARRAVLMRAQGLQWKEIAAALGHVGTGSVYTLAKKHGGPA